MTEPEKPGEGEPAPYSLPSWIDHAIARSKGDPPPPVPEAPASDERHALHEVSDEDQEIETVSDEEPTAEYPAVFSPAAPPRPASDPRTEVVPHFLGATEEDKRVAYPTVPEPRTVEVEKQVHPEAAVAPTEAEPRRGSAIPWVVAALFLAAAALVLAYLIWMRPVNA